MLQFGLPRGPLGHLVGQGLARENLELTRWVIAQLDPGPAHAVLEIGCGPAVAVDEVLRRSGGGGYDGVDPSTAMLRQARLRNRREIEAGRARIHRAQAAALPFADDRFHRALCVNVIYFWDDPVVELTEVGRVLAPGGRLAIGIRPRSAIPDELRQRFEEVGHRTYEPEDIGALLQSAGFGAVRTVTAQDGYAAILGTV